MRFDDSLQTVLAADTSSAFGAQSAFRQLVDLVGRRRVADLDGPIDRLRALRSRVPTSVRAASARALALGDPPADLVAFFAEDESAVAAPVLRVAKLSDEEWTALLPRIGPAGRALLRGRPGLSAATVRALAAFGTTDFTIGHDGSPAATPTSAPPPTPVEAVPSAMTGGPDRQLPTGGTFAIADLVERIETFQRGREQADPAEEPRPSRFSFEADPRGMICWVEGIGRAGLIGRRLDPPALPAPERVLTTKLRIDSPGETASDWEVSAVPLFASDSGRFGGWRGVARRAVARTRDAAIEPEALRRLVHELRTPTNAISGFAELIATELLGPAPAPHRARAGAIGRDVDALLGAIEDLEISARIDGNALDLAPRPVDLDAALRRTTADGRLRPPAPSRLRVIADERALDRLLARLAGIAAGGVTPGTPPAEITLRVEPGAVTIGWPSWRQAQPASLLGVDFSLRLAQRLAGTLGGTLVIQPDRLTLRLPVSFNGEVQATTH